MEAPKPYDQFELGTEPLTNEQLAEVERLRHGIAVLDLFDEEVAAEDRRDDFLRRTHPGTETRQAILQGNAYSGNEKKLENARSKAINNYELSALRLRAMHEHAQYLGIAAEIQGKRIIIENKEDERRLQVEHGRWRADLASRHTVETRVAYRAFLQAKIRAITGQEEKASSQEEVPEIAEGPSVNLEERAILLVRAINAMAHRSKLSGLQVAIPDEQYNEPIYERYDTGTLRLDRNAQHRSDRLFLQVRRDFWHASGFPTIRESGTVPQHLIERRSGKMWKEFLGQFEHAPQQKHREKVRKQLKKYIPQERLAETSIENV